MPYHPSHSHLTPRHTLQEATFQASRERELTTSVPCLPRARKHGCHANEHVPFVKITFQSLILPSPTLLVHLQSYSEMATHFLAHLVRGLMASLGTHPFVLIEEAGKEVLA